MTLDEYQRLAVAEARDQGSELIQRVLGLAGESGEIADRVKAWYRDSGADPARLERGVLAAELGDALWYVAALADHLGVTLEEVARGNLTNLAARRARRGTPTR